MARKTTSRELTADDLAAIKAGGVYRCLGCGQWNRTVGDLHRHKDTSPACDDRVSVTR